ncbi:hypothetical protein JOD55_001324 [Arcanobacterium pluranimalium]|uniref:septation protein SepH n=1 Tax=Arcanobacterium pluranimalium TaxID=108028 RepID=UPI00195E42B0|nr:septation protein SepH [Arcanobacterium pluranimalium]MBM7825497.1 hypothetical protein [Arcanobacterium pluranimalium]
MIELELLGLDADGAHLSLNDVEGNRYSLPISDELRAALRRDLPAPAQAELKPLSPREIQAYFRAGKTISEVSELTSVPPSQLSSLEHPIKVERQYNASLARAFRLSQDNGGMTLEELVVSRLVDRGLNGAAIEWDAVRESGEPWALIARYTIASNNYEARWTLNMKSQTVVALNDEASWLTETQIPAPHAPWRPLNTPRIPAEGTFTQQQGNSAAPISSDTAAQAPHSDPAAAVDLKNVSTLPFDNAHEETDESPASSSINIDDVLASLDSQRGVSRPMPVDFDEEEFTGAHPADSEPYLAQDATVLQLPTRNTEASDSDDELVLPVDVDDFPIDSADSDSLPGLSTSESELSDAQKSNATAKKKTRRDRPAMPSWDEIVFGYSKDD